MGQDIYNEEGQMYPFFVANKGATIPYWYAYYLMVDDSWPIARQQKIKEEEWWYPFFEDKHTNVVQKVVGHHGKDITLVEKPFEAKQALENDLSLLIDLQDDLPPFIDLVPMG